MSRDLAGRLPDFPWDTLVGAAARARAHPDGICDLSVGTPVDPTPPVAKEALTAAAEAPGYPTVAGTDEVRTAIHDYLVRRWAARGLEPRAVLPLIGTKEFVAWLPTLLGLGADDTVVIPRIAYPTYQVGALTADAAVVTATDEPEDLGELRPALLWLNSPANPTGEIWDAERLRRWVSWARERGTIVASDECYGEFGWTAEPVSVLDERVNDGDCTGLLAVHSLSKRSNVAGYRLGFVAGDAEVVPNLIGLRKHLGMMMPAPMQHTMTVLLSDESHVVTQRERYLRRREILAAALTGAGFRIDHSEGSLYLWASRGENCRTTVDWLADRGILVAPGDFYGELGNEHVRVALTATDERVEAAAARLS
ncbi:succinyldiaminopimelate transaminase [Enemella sp. A6]|uniref:succinyldiaminopimelate transaminase n=1 Tax=Enemella sp. A6 TaxID=3440152 RepID=UPI003EB88C41